MKEYTVRFRQKYKDEDTYTVEEIKRKGTKVVRCCECKFCGLMTYDYHRTGEEPYDPYLCCFRLKEIQECVHAYDFCSKAKSREEKE